MVYLIAVLFGLSVASLLLCALQATRDSGPRITLRLTALEPVGVTSAAPARGRKLTGTERLRTSLQRLGAPIRERINSDRLRQQLTEAGWRQPEALSTYLGIRAGLTLLAALLLLVLTMALGRMGALAALGIFTLCWIGPAFYIGRRTLHRRKEMRKAVPDVLDALVISMEAGLGLSQALLRVADQTQQVSPHLSAELAITNLEIRTGAPRDEALRNLAGRVGLPEMRSLVSALIQTDRFGTSVTQALRVQADFLREKRRQGVEEAAAKTTVKMLFPLVFFVFPAMFVVTLGPVVIQMLDALKR